MASKAASNSNYVIFDRAASSGCLCVFRAASRSQGGNSVADGEDNEAQLLRGIAAFEAARVSRHTAVALLPLESFSAEPFQCSDCCSSCVGDGSCSDEEAEADSLVAISEDEASERSIRISRNLKKLQSIVGGDWIDAAALLARAISHIKLLQAQAALAVHNPGDAAETFRSTVATVAFRASSSQIPE